MLAFLAWGVVVVRKWSAAACRGTCTYLFSVTGGVLATHMLCRRWMSSELGRQNSDSRLPMLEREAIDAIDASDELRLRGAFVSYCIQGMSPFWLARATMMSVWYEGLWLMIESWRDGC